VAINAPGEMLVTHARIEEDAGKGRKFQQPLIQVEKRHVASGTASEPGRRQFQTSHCFFSRAVMMNCSRVRSFSISATVEPCRKIAPVGHACTHLPHDVQVTDSPHGWFMSVMTRALVPRPMTSHVCTPSTWSHTRTQRVHSTQRLWSMPNDSWDTSMPTCGWR